jgi:S1-C subfamily serine protease
VQNGPRPVLGIDVKDDEGIRVTAVREGGPADTANLAVGDRIVSLNGNQYANSNSFIAAIGRMQPGDAVKVRIDRDGQHYQATARLAAQEEVLKVPALEAPPRAEPTPADPETKPAENELP